MFANEFGGMLRWYPTTVEELRVKITGNVVLPQNLESIIKSSVVRDQGWVWVTDKDAPPYDPTQEKIVYGVPLKVGGKWFRYPKIHMLNTQEKTEMFLVQFAKLKKMLDNRVTALIEQKAVDLGYGDEFTDAKSSICSYVHSNIPQFRREAKSFIAWRDSIWMYLLGLQNDIEAGKITIPTQDEVIAGLPEFVMLSSTTNT